MEVELSEGTMLSFYKKHKVAPVFQNIPDMHEHFHRRKTLYKQLVISPSDFTGKRILEIGPGNGQNALFWASQKPQILTLVEPNPTGISKMEETFFPYSDYKEFVEVKNVRIEDFVSSRKYDFVFCEGLIGSGGYSDSKEIINSIAAHVDSQGMLVLTCVEYPGYCAEMLRRMLGYELSKDIESFDDRVALLSHIFEPHLENLHAMTRNVEDWIIDSLINPASVGDLVTFSDLVENLSQLGFEVRGTSPRFITDWAWYKNAALESDFFNKTAIRSYWEGAHCFMDYRTTYGPRDPVANKKLIKLCQELHEKIRQYEETNGSLICRNVIIKKIETLIHLVSSDMPSVGEALQEVYSWLRRPALKASIIRDSQLFGCWFGRAQTYALFEPTQERG